MPKPVDDSQEVTLVPRVKGFTNQYITKGSYSDAEFKIKRLAVLIFNSEGNLAFSKEYNTSSVVLNKTMLNLNSATVVMFANVSLSDIKKQTVDAEGTSTWTDITTDTELTLEGLDGYSIDLGSNPVVLETDLGGDAFNGFPMKGVASNVNLTPSASDAVEVSLQILYAKVNFEISVAEGTENQTLTEDGTSFTLSGYSVHNVSKITSVAELGEENSTASDDYAYTGTSPKAGSLPSDVNKVASTANSSKVAFTFYMAETCYNHGGTSGVYPVSDLPEEYKQQYKPKLATNGTGAPATGLASHVTISGRYIDYRGTAWDVNYTVYLGKNSHDDFHVDRNSEYKNYLTIKGIRNNNNYGDIDVWVDHRVDVELGKGQGLDDCITITRETLIDSHFEVRPLRVNLTEKSYVGACVFLPRYNGKQITEIKDDGVNQNWIAIENNDGTRYQDITQYCANGKRKYFTTDLIEDLHLNNPDVEENGSEKVISLENNDCIWIYIDEYTTRGATSDREAQIELRFYKSATQYDSEIYTIRQKPLFYTGEYYIESYEEYLHSYDSEDRYNLETSAKNYTQEGIVWGLSGEKLSKDILVSTIELWGLNRLDIRNVISQRYDYISDSDGQSYPYIKSGDSWISQGFESGLEFTHRASANTNMTITDMGTAPTSAYQYCLSKNKFKKDADGKHSMDIHWYLPDVSELQSILMADVEADADIVSDAFYWSSQPSYTQSGLEDLPLVEEFIEENPTIVEYLKEKGVDLTNLGVKDELATSARAVSKSSEDADKDRIDIHRVRCLYSASGKENVNMTDRAPDGIGPKVIHMRAKRRDTGGAGYFAQYVPIEPTEVDPVPTREFKGEDDDYAYPTRGDYSDGSFSYNPMLNWVTRLSASWGDAVPDVDKFTLGKYPGLSAKIIEDRQLVVGTTDYTILEGSDWKSDTEIIVSSTEKVVDYSNLGDDKLNLNKLDGTNGIFSIAFSIGNNTKNYPKYYYYEETGKVTETWTRHWKIPEYYKDTFITTKEDVISNKTFNGSASDVNTVGDVYFRKNEAKTAAENKAKETAIKDAISKIVYPGPGYNYEVTSQSATVTGSNTYYAGLGYVGTASATATVTVKFTRPVGTPIEAWRYTDNTGRWFNEEDEEWPNEETNDNEWPNYYTKETVTTPKYNNDELTFYSGNKFTISVAQGYVIGGVKVHFSGSNTISRTDTYLRFVPEGYSSSTDHPERMSFVDGDSGYAEWGTQEGCSQVTLQLSEATLTEPSWWQQIFGQEATINYKTDNLSYTGESLIIEKIEITYMSASN